MKIVGTLGTKTLSSCFHIEGWDKTFEYKGYVYAVISNNGESQHTKIYCTNGMIPCLNLKSHTVRALDIYTEVNPLKCELHYESCPL